MASILNMNYYFLNFCYIFAKLEEIVLALRQDDDERQELHWLSYYGGNYESA